MLQGLGGKPALQALDLLVFRILGLLAPGSLGMPVPEKSGRPAAAAGMAPAGEVEHSSASSSASAAHAGTTSGPVAKGKGSKAQGIPGRGEVAGQVRHGLKRGREFAEHLCLGDAMQVQDWVSHVPMLGADPAVCRLS